MKITGNTVLITGATSGIGLGLARRLKDEGNEVVIAGRRKDAIDEVSARFGFDGVVIDVSDAESIKNGVRTVIERHPELNVVVNNAGIMLPENVLEPGWLPVAEESVATNLLGPIRIVAEVLPHLLGRAEAWIVNVSSGLAFVPLPLTPTYSATKSGIHAFSEAVRVQLAGTSVGIVEIAPPPVRTKLMNQEEREEAMPLEGFLDEVMSILRADPDGHEVLVDAVKPFRNAQAEGTYDTFLEALSQRR
ncbi:SDR family oxidoreductase [Microtetraspora malaysiensis]|uniref:SDR family oxidoreductase n=1 Tax=Microtetraspora malaysiensis TaxID=161358 RepID=UPI00082D1032|nr:SDR family NAD(P)-dependent oxidoreductase [Microtetraspora malaysiensis]